MAPVAPKQTLPSGPVAQGAAPPTPASASADLRAAVTATNDGRRRVYAQGAAEAGTTADVAGARMFEAQLFPRIASGQWYRNAQGEWVQR